MSRMRRRAEAARRFSTTFGVGTECGFGRRPAQTIPGLLELHRTAADELAGPATTFQPIGR